MRKLNAVLAVVGTIAVITGCTSMPSEQPVPVTMDMGMARQSVKIYDVMPQYGSPLEQVSATICDGTRERTTDRIITLASQRGANGLLQPSCTTAGMSFSCWSTTTCSGMAIKIDEPPPPPPPKRGKPKPKPKRA